MRKFITVLAFMILVFLSRLSSEEIKIYYPSQNQQICRTEPLIIKWTGNAVDYIIEANSELSDGYKKLSGYEIKDKTFFWYVNDKDFLNVPFTVRISNLSDLTDFDEISAITVFEETQILAQTNSIVTCAGDEVYLKVDALGYGLTYQWFKDGKKLENQETATLLIKNAEYKNSGLFTCLLSSAGQCESIISKPISVYVVTKTEFLSAPEEVFWEYGKSAVMTAAIHANSEYESENIKFNWYKDTIIYIKVQNGFIADTIWKELVEGKKYTGTKSQELAIKNLVWSDQTTYYCIAEGLCGSDTVSCVIGDESRFEIIKVSPDFFGCEGQDVVFKAKVISGVNGTFTYQWYKTGFKMLKEGDKFKGTNTLELTIKNSSYKDDLNNYYVLVTWVEKKVSKRSEHFEFYPLFVPQILLQPKKVVTGGDRQYGLQTHIYVTIENITDCKFEWFRNDTLVRTQYRKFESNYFLSTFPDNPRLFSAEDAGVYRCRISNECGEVWSDTSVILAPYPPVIACEGDDIDLKVYDMKDLYGEYTYIWKRNPLDTTIVRDSDYYSGSTTNTLHIKNINGKPDFYVYAKNINTGAVYYVGLIKYIAKVKPEISKQIPQLIKNHSPYIPENIILVGSYGPELNYQIYKDGQPWTETKTFYMPDSIYTYFEIPVGGKNIEFETGIYYLKFWNDCGEKNSRQFEVEIVGGIVDNDNDSSKQQDENTTGVFSHNILKKNIHVYPNPAEDYITFQITEVLKTTEDCKVQLFNIFGFEVISTPSLRDTPQEGNFRIDISDLQAGVYYIRIGSSVGKFVKI